MIVHILAIGQVRRGPERELIDDYVDRYRKTGRSLGLRDLVEAELPSAPTPEEEAAALLARCPPGAVICAMDERGKARTSRDFSSWLAHLRDAGMRDLCFLIGGASGHGAAVREAAREVLALGPQTWPHKLARVMLAEQLYRAASLMAGSPYHKD